MTALLPFALVAAGGAFGSAARYAATLAVSRLLPGAFPYGTLAVNVSGSFLMGVWMACAARQTPQEAQNWHLLLAVGVLGGFTTFSTFSLDAYALLARGQGVQAAAYMACSVLLSLGALMLGMWLVRP